MSLECLARRLISLGSKNKARLSPRAMSYNTVVRKRDGSGAGATMEKLVDLLDVEFYVALNFFESSAQVE